MRAPTYERSKEPISPIRERDESSEEKKLTLPQPQFIMSLYQDEDLRIAMAKKEGGLTFTHSETGDIDRCSTIQETHPPMSSATVDWSIISSRNKSPTTAAQTKKRQHNKWSKKNINNSHNRNGTISPEQANALPIGSQDTTRSTPSLNNSVGLLNFGLKKGIYSKKKTPSHRGRNNKQKKMKPLSTNE